MIGTFRSAIYQKLRSQPSAAEVELDPELQVEPARFILDLDEESFRIWGFIDDDIAFETDAPGREVRRAYGINHDIQRAFYSGYFTSHGLKSQVIVLPNGMVRSIFIAGPRQSDRGLLNMSGLNEYLATLFSDTLITLESDGVEIDVYPALYGDCTFPQTPTIVSRWRTPTLEQDFINRRMASARMAIEHMFGIHRSTFKMFGNPRYNLQLRRKGKQAVQSVFNSFLLYNCRQFLRQSSVEFGLLPPSLEDYLPLHEVLQDAPIASDEALGAVYHYGPLLN